MNKKNIIIIISLLVLVSIGVFLVFEKSDFFDAKDNNSSVEEEDATVNSEIDNEPEGKEDIDSIEEEEIIKPDWSGKSYAVDNEDFDYMSSKQVNLWESYEDRTLVVSISRYAEVKLLGYRKDYDYCQIEYAGKIGWFACAWLKNLPDNMVDYWE